MQGPAPLPLPKIATERAETHELDVPKIFSKNIACLALTITSTALVLPEYEPLEGGLLTVTITFVPSSVKPFEPASALAAAVTSLYGISFAPAIAALSAAFCSIRCM